MRVGLVPENLLERVLLATGVGPTPLADTLVAMMLARTLMAGTQLGVFEALADGPLSAAEVARRCGTEPRATAKLLFALAGIGYLEADGDRYELARVARRWLLEKSPQSLRDAVLHRYLDLGFMAHYEDYVRTGEPVRFHDKMTPAQWRIYQRGQRAHATYMAPEVAMRVPVPRGATAMLDIGGSHGHYSVVLCRAHPKLRSTILDLPSAVEHAAPLLVEEGMGDRVAHRAGNALEADLGEAQYDLVFIGNLVHHFDEEANRALARRVARALRPGGVYAILDLIRAHTPREAGQIAALTDLFFAVTSRSGTWTFQEMAAWQSAAGLVPRRAARIRTAPGYGLQCALKPT